METRALCAPLQQVDCELLVVGLYEDEKAPTGVVAELDQVLAGQISSLLTAGDFRAKPEQTIVVYTQGRIRAKRVLLVGLGTKAKLALEGVRRSSGAAARAVRALAVTKYCSELLGAGAEGIGPVEAAQAIAEGAILGAYSFVGHKKDHSDDERDLESLTLITPEAALVAHVQKSAAVGRILAEATCWARDLANEPGNKLSPSILAQSAQTMSRQAGLRCAVLDKQLMSTLGMGALLGVAQGSHEEPRFIILEHKPNSPELDTYVVIGKGLTFDSGGISLKPSEGMERMKDDMSGAAATLAAMRAVAALDLPLHVVGLIPATENMPGGAAYKPGDVLTSMSGLTIEIISTDAEGRVILADALTYATKFQPKAVIDLATLTGACVVALGNQVCGVLGNDSKLVQSLLDAARVSGESAWELPLYADYNEQIKSDVADVKNTGGRPAGTITGALFLAKFAQSYPWAHLDIAGPVWSEATKGYVVKGATGFGVRLVVEWLRCAAASSVR